MRILICLLTLSAVIVTPLHAQEYKRNAWGMLFAPTTYRLTEGYRFETNVSNTSMDVGLFYARFFTRRFSARVEMIGQQRHMNTFVETPVPGDPDPTPLYSLDESSVTGVLLLAGDRRVDLSGHELRFSAGGGLTVTGVFEQTLGTPEPAEFEVGEEQYGKIGYLLDAGITLSLDPRTGVFTRFRYQADQGTFSASKGDIDRRYDSFGFLAGAEFFF